MLRCFQIFYQLIFSLYLNTLLPKMIDTFKESELTVVKESQSKANSPH